jgi:catechol 2,3-dioxygenase-like lactoylglutathione lyase family enzyme
MAKIRHIAIRTGDVERAAAFFQEVFGLQLVQRRAHGPIDLSDGDINLTLLPLHLNAGGRELRPGVEHLGFTVTNEEETRRRILAQGAKELTPVQLGDVYYEAKFECLDGVIVDVGHWRGASPVEEPTAATATE